MPQIKWIDKESKQWKKDKDRIKITLNDISRIMKALFKVKKKFWMQIYSRDGVID